MTLLDANALIALLRGEPAEDEVIRLLRSRDCAAPVLCLAEMVDKLIRHWGVHPDHVSERAGALIDESMSVIEIDIGTGWRTGEFRANHYDRKDAALSLSDCALLATAGPDDEIATSDRAVFATARDLGIGVIPLPDSQGQLPTV